MKQNFFKDMTKLDKELSETGWNRTCFQRLVAFVEAGRFTQSSSSKFIAVNWRLTVKELCSKWNSENVLEKSRNTFRSQVSTLSRQLYALFPAVYEKFTQDNRKAIQRMLDTISLLEDGDEFYNELFVSELCKRDFKYSGREYSVEDCADEIKALRRFSRKNINELLDLVDEDKMGYLQRVLQTPLASNRYRNINIEKIEILRELSLYDDDFDDTAVEEVQGLDKVDNYSKYGFSDMRELVHVLEERAAENPVYIQADDLEKSSMVLMKYIGNLFSKEKLKSAIMQIPAEDVYMILQALLSEK